MLSKPTIIGSRKYYFRAPITLVRLENGRKSWHLLVQFKRSAVVKRRARRGMRIGDDLAEVAESEDEHAEYGG
jgi:hypothetical protein